MSFRKTAAVLLVFALALSGCGKTPQPESEGQPQNANVEANAAVRGNTSGNITNYGSAAEYNGDIYCQYGDKGEKFARISADGKIDILKESMPYFINIVDGAVYYVDAGDNFRLHKMDADGSNDIALTSGSAYYVNIVDGSIYYADPTAEYCVYKMGMDDMKPQKIINNNCQYLTVAGDKLYFSDFSANGELTQCGLDGSDIRQINAMQSMYINYYDGYIYYSGTDADKNSGMYRQPVENGPTEQIYDTEVGDINVNDGKIYFTD